MSSPPRPNDIGGLPAGPIDTSDPEPLPWHKEVMALRGAVGRAGRKIFNLHEGRRAIEDLGEERYNRLGYFERFLQSSADLLVEKGVLTHEEIQARMAEIRARRKNG